MMKWTWTIAALALAACGSAREARDSHRTERASGATTGSAVLPPLPEVMDRIREAGGVLIAAHRGGPAPGYPENAVETMQYGFEQGIRVFEVDVAESQDGVLYLMHDRSLRRTGGHDGGVADTDWAVVRALDLLDSSGQATGFHPPSLEETLGWARRNGAILELDRKETTSFRNIISAVRSAGAENHVLMISYNDQEAIEVARLGPELMMTAGVDSLEHQERLAAEGVNFTHVVAWMGTRSPDVRAFAELGERGIESAFGTLGRPGKRLDDEYAADGDASEYQALVDGGLTLLATDKPYFVARELRSDDLALEVLKMAR